MSRPRIAEKRGPDTWSLKPQDTVFDALKVLADHNIGALMVLDGGQLVGVFSSVTARAKIALAGKSSKDTRVQDIMTTKCITVSPQVRTRDALALMKPERHSPPARG